jgi:hypothetical protein
MLVASGAFVATADVYRWVDANGSVHYSDVPNQGAVLIRGTSKNIPQPRNDSYAAQNSAQSSSDAQRDRQAGIDGAISDRLTQENTARAVQDDIAKKRGEQCKEATKRYDTSITSRRLYRQGANGERVYLSDAEIDQARVQARAERDTACGSSRR